MRRALLALVILFSSAVLFSTPGQYRFDTWTTDNGLPQNGVRQITQTPEGYLWFTTFDGLVRFDGIRFTTFNKSNTKGIANNRFTGIFADVDGSLYATTMEDGILTILRDGEFKTLDSDDVPGRYISRIERHDTGELRFLVEEESQERNWYRISESRFEFIEKQVTDVSEHVHVARNGVKWTIRPNGVTEEREGVTTFLPADLRGIDLLAKPFEDRDGGIWLGSSRVFHFKDGRLRIYDEGSGLPADALYGFFWQDQDGSVWFASGTSSTRGHGLFQISNSEVRIWGAEHGLPNSSIQNIFHDREGTTWLATTRGLSRRRKLNIQGYSTQHGLDYSEVYPMFRDRDDNIWIGTARGLNTYRDGKFEPVEIRPDVRDIGTSAAWKPGRMSIQALWQDGNGKLWVGVGGGLYLVEDGLATSIFQGAHVFAIKNDSKGNVWAATGKGLLKFNDYRITSKYTSANGLPNDFMSFVHEDSKGTLWFGGWGGISRYENGGFVNFTAKDGLAGNYVRTIYEDGEGTMWIGTYDEGLSRFKDGKFTSFREGDGLYSNGVFAIEEDEQGTFWISSNRGIYRVSRKELNDFADGKIRRFVSIGYGKDDGMLSNECNGGRQPASLRDREGRFWFPTQEGIAILDPRVDRANVQPPTVVIEDVLVERQLVPFRNGASVAPGSRDLQIDYTGINLIKSSQVRFQYRLEGHDADWIDAGTKRSAHYSYLPPGDYKFHVRAANSDGIWAEQPASVAITMQPYFYQTTGFYLLAGLGVVVLLTGGWRASVYQLRARERKLTKMVAERTEELAKANEHLERLANSDSLTRIGNRRRFETFLSDEWHRAVRFKTEISLVLLDIDHFKHFNDTYGHQAGDECLQRVAEAFAETIKRPTDLVARFGGEEFAIVLGGTDSDGALNIAEEAVANVKALKIPHSSSDTSPVLTVSVGIATMYATIDGSEDDLIHAADKALYQAKRNGRDRIYHYDRFAMKWIERRVALDDVGV